MPVTSESVLITADAAAAAFYSCMSVCLHIQFNGYGGTRENEDCVDYELAMMMMMMTTIFTWSLPGFCASSLHLLIQRGDCISIHIYMKYS